LKKGIFIGPQIRDIIKDEFFDKLLQGNEKPAWDSFKFVVKVFLGNRRAQNYEEPVNNLLQSYQKLGYNMSLKMSFVAFGFFPENFGALLVLFYLQQHSKHQGPVLPTLSIMISLAGL